LLLLQHGQINHAVLRQRCGHCRNVRLAVQQPRNTVLERAQSVVLPALFSTLEIRARQVAELREIELWRAVG
jgi:hypothetical protein